MIYNEFDISNIPRFPEERQTFYARSRPGAHNAFVHVEYWKLLVNGLMPLVRCLHGIIDTAVVS